VATIWPPSGSQSDFDFDTAPPAAVVVIGAQSRPDLPAKLHWVRRVAREADVVLSVCTGAFVLANTGLIDGMTATTHHNFYDMFEARFPDVELVRGRRFVDNGRFISAGASQQESMAHSTLSPATTAMTSLNERPIT
jgi:transcriptional regulator GlxA family with amidase domain